MNADIHEIRADRLAAEGRIVEARNERRLAAASRLRAGAARHRREGRPLTADRLAEIACDIEGRLEEVASR